MATNSSRDLTTLDFESIKDNLKEYLKSQDTFQDYDFEASNINVLLDVLAYNTNLNAFYLNMISNEMFLDSALLRDSIVSHAKELNYLPRSFRSAVADVDITVTNPNLSTLTIPRGTSFTGSTGDRDFTFVTAENINVGGSDGVFDARNVLIYEGDYTQDSYVVDYENPIKYEITNKTVDTNSIIVSVIEDNGENILSYQTSETLFGLDSQSQVFFIQPSVNETYEIVFGDGVIGRRPKDRSIVVVEYRACNGELPNGLSNFVSDGDIGGTSNIVVTTNSPASGGAIPESITSIKQNAPRSFTTQERVVTTDDYETLLKTNFSEVNAVSAYGGEEAVPPQFGKVIIAVDLKTTDELPPSRRTAYRNFIKPRSPLSIDPVFVSPDFTYVQVNTNVKYNINETSLSQSDIESIVASAVQNFNVVNLNGFNKTLFYSNLVSSIDGSQAAIVSNDTELFAVKLFEPFVGQSRNYDIDFGMSLNDIIGQLAETRPNNEISVLRSTPFFFNGVECFLEDDGNGLMRIMTNQQEARSLIREIGTVDYQSGLVKLENFRPQSIIGEQIELRARTLERDITSQRRTILSIRDVDINVSVEQVRL